MDCIDCIVEDIKQPLSLLLLVLIRLQFYLVLVFQILKFGLLLVDILLDDGFLLNDALLLLEILHQLYFLCLELL